MPRRPADPAAYHRSRPGAPGEYVRRRDSLDRTYFIHRESGKRAPRSAWEADRERIAFERAVYRREREERVGAERGRAPFPEGVGPTGVPVGPVRRPRDEGPPVGPTGAPVGPIRVPADWGEEGGAVDVDEFQPYPIDGEDDTG
jgi:hypothetical protein